MLIAIMSDTYTKVSKKSHESAMKEKINVLADFILVLQLLKLETNF